MRSFSNDISAYNYVTVHYVGKAQRMLQNISMFSVKVKALEEKLKNIKSKLYDDNHNPKSWSSNEITYYIEKWVERSLEIISNRENDVIEPHTSAADLAVPRGTRCIF